MEHVVQLQRTVLEQLADAQMPAARLLLGALEAFLRPPEPPRLAGVLNVTPDSFSDGGRYLDPQAAVERGLTLVDEGADLIDVGGESTRPGARAVPAAEERQRVVPVIAALAERTRVPLSVDTTKAAVAEAALDAGATLVNDVSAGRFDPLMLALVADRGCDLVLMHMLGTPRDMQRDPRYGEVVADVLEDLRGRRRRSRQASRRRGCGSTRGSASERPSSTTSSWSAGSRSYAPWACPCTSVSPASRSSGASMRRPDAAGSRPRPGWAARRLRWRPACALGSRSCACTTWPSPERRRGWPGRCEARQFSRPEHVPAAWQHGLAAVTIGTMRTREDRRS
jgi:hypothetical protein